MKYLTDREGARRLERRTIEEFGIGSLILMERAALSAAQAVMEYFPRGEVFILAGSGNNGADGLALARILLGQGIPARVAAVGNPGKATQEWRYQCALLEKMGIPVTFLSSPVRIPEGCRVYVDALFGIGLSRPLEGIYREAVEAFNRTVKASHAAALSLDVPSGVDSSTGKLLQAAVKADVTVSFGPAKAGLVLYPGASMCGRLVTADIGLLRDPCGEDCVFSALEMADVREIIGTRLPYGNKGTFGTALVIAGAPGMAGAACFAAKAAYLAGAGLVRVLTAPENREVLQIRLPEAVMVPPPEKESLRDTVFREMSRAACVIAGPGLSQSETASALLEAVIESPAGIPVILDADALNLLSCRESLPELSERFVLTPHPGELSRLLKTAVPEIAEKGLLSCSQTLHALCGAVCVCKDARTVIRTGAKPVYLNLTGNDGMAVGGSGDVLAGLIGGLAAQGIPAGPAAAAGVWIHGAAGDEAARILGRHSMTAESILNGIPAVMKRMEGEERSADVKTAGPGFLSEWRFC